MVSLRHGCDRFEIWKEKCHARGSNDGIYDSRLAGVFDDRADVAVDRYAGYQVAEQ